MTPADDDTSARWLLLIHQIPPKPDYLRVKVGRRLQRLGAVPVKNSVYALPSTDAALEDLHWLRAEIVEAGGDAVICRAELLAGVDDAELRRRLDERAAERAPRPAAVTRDDVRGSTWVTREGIFVDRIASAWLIGRFIDPEARFRFVPATGHRPRKGELRFDMFDAEFTHVGDRCTFEVLCERFALDDPALQAIAEVVHDIDLKDAKYGREETAGIERVLAGVVRAHPDDETRLARGRQLFDDLYALHADAP
jgi:hypothetical protein